MIKQVAIYGRYAVYSPYNSHSGPVAWTVQCVEPGDEPEDLGEWLAEFRERHDAELFAVAKFTAESTHEQP